MFVVGMGHSLLLWGTRRNRSDLGVVKGSGPPLGKTQFQLLPHVPPVELGTAPKPVGASAFLSVRWAEGSAPTPLGSNRGLVPAAESALGRS